MSSSDFFIEGGTARIVHATRLFMPLVVSPPLYGDGHTAACYMALMEEWSV